MFLPSQVSRVPQKMPAKKRPDRKGRAQYPWQGTSPLGIRRSMSSDLNTWLAAGAALSGLAAILHICIIFGGAPWYRFFGAGERMARAADRGNWQPTVITSGIAIVLFVWAAYALSGAGVSFTLPFTKAALIGITSAYMLRGLLFVPILMAKRQKITKFAIWSSIICLGFGLTHLLGTLQVWHKL